MFLCQSVPCLHTFYARISLRTYKVRVLAYMCTSLAHSTLLLLCTPSLTVAMHEAEPVVEPLLALGVGIELVQLQRV